MGLKEIFSFQFWKSLLAELAASFVRKLFQLALERLLITAPTHAG